MEAEPLTWRSHETLLTDMSEDMCYLLIHAVVGIARIDDMTLSVRESMARGDHLEHRKTASMNIIKREFNNWISTPLSDRRAYLTELYQSHKESADAAGRDLTEEFKQHFGAIKELTEYIESLSVASFLGDAIISSNFDESLGDLFEIHLDQSFTLSHIREAFHELDQLSGENYSNMFLAMVNLQATRISNCLNIAIKDICNDAVDGSIALDGNFEENVVSVFRHSLLEFLKQELRIVFLNIERLNQSPGWDRDELWALEYRYSMRDLKRRLSFFFGFESPLVGHRVYSYMFPRRRTTFTEREYVDSDDEQSEDGDQLLDRVSVLITNEENTACPICREDCDSLRKTLRCDHFFCSDCLRAQLRSDLHNQYRCALCRQWLLPEGDGEGDV